MGLRSGTFASNTLGSLCASTLRATAVSHLTLILNHTFCEVPPLPFGHQGFVHLALLLLHRHQVIVDDLVKVQPALHLFTFLPIDLLIFLIFIVVLHLPLKFALHIRVNF